MRVVGSASSSKPRCIPSAHTFDVGAGGIGDEKIAEVPVDDTGEDFNGREVSVNSFDPQKWNCKQIWLPISQLD